MQTFVPRQLNLSVASLVLATALAVVTPLLASERINFPSALRQAVSAVQLSGYLYWCPDASQSLSRRSPWL
jgi:hypothetical protein